MAWELWKKTMVDAPPSYASAYYRYSYDSVIIDSIKKEIGFFIDYRRNDDSSSGTTVPFTTGEKFDFEFEKYKYEFRVAGVLNAIEFLESDLSRVDTQGIIKLNPGPRLNVAKAEIEVYRKEKGTSGKISELTPGTLFNFGGENWFLLNSETGFSIHSGDVGSMKYGIYAEFSTVYDGIGKHLNTTYLDAFTEKEKQLLLNASWKVNPGKVVNAKIGLISLPEWKLYSVKGNPISGFLTGLIGRFWTLTASAGSAVYSISTDGSETSSASDGFSYKMRPAIYINKDTIIVNGKVVHNVTPSLLLNTQHDKTLYENDTLLIDGQSTDLDSGDIVSVRYQINSETIRAIATGISDGATAIAFNRQLTFKAGKLHYNGVDVTGALAEGVAHTLKVWAEDDKGGKSSIAERAFYVVPNRPPKLTINPFTAAADLIDTDNVTITGTTSDPDGNDTVVSFKLNNGLATEIYRGSDSEWSFDLLLSSLKLGENTAVVETVDAYNFKTSLTRKLNKQANLTPLAKSVQRYTLVPPAGTAQGVLMWIERDATQSLTAEISMTNGTEQEQFKPMTLDSSGPANVGTVEDFFKFRADMPVEKIAIKLSWTGDKPIFKVSGALTQ